MRIPRTLESSCNFFPFPIVRMNDWVWADVRACVRAFVRAYVNVFSVVMPTEWTNEGKNWASLGSFVHSGRMLKSWNVEVSLISLFRMGNAFRKVVGIYTHTLDIDIGTNEMHTTIYAFFHTKTTHTHAHSSWASIRMENAVRLWIGFWHIPHMNLLWWFHKTSPQIKCSNRTYNVAVAVKLYHQNHFFCCIFSTRPLSV